MLRAADNSTSTSAVVIVMGDATTCDLELHPGFNVLTDATFEVKELELRWREQDWPDATSEDRRPRQPVLPMPLRPRRLLPPIRAPPLTRTSNT